MTPSPDISFFVPCCNEEAHIASTLETLDSVLAKRKLTYEIIVVDDASVDQTIQKVEAYRVAHPEKPVRLIRNAKNRGLGYNYVKTTESAKGKYYMLINGDNDISHKTISDVLDQIGKAEMIIPYIENQGDRSRVRRVISRAFTALVNFITGNRLKYYNGPVLHLRETISRFKPDTAGFAYQAEILADALSRGYSYLEIPFASVTRIQNRTAAFHVSNILAVTVSLLRLLSKRLRKSPDAEARDSSSQTHSPEKIP